MKHRSNQSSIIIGFAHEACIPPVNVIDSLLLMQVAAQGSPGPVALLQQRICGRDSCTTFEETSFTMGKVKNCNILRMPFARVHACSRHYLVLLI